MVAIQNVFRNHKQSSKSLDDENVTSRTKQTATKRRSPVLFRPKMRNNSFFRSCLGPKQNFFSGKLSKKSRLVAASEGTKAAFFQPSFQFKETSSSYDDRFLCLFLCFLGKRKATEPAATPLASRGTDGPLDPITNAAAHRATRRPKARSSAGTRP